MQVSVGAAVLRLRDEGHLAITQVGLAEILGPPTSAITVSRWERGLALPYPKTRAKLADIAMRHGWWDIASALDVPVPMDDFVAAFRTNVEGLFKDWVKVTMCVLNASSCEEDQIEKEYGQMMALAEKLCASLKAKAEGGATLIEPPNRDVKEVWAKLIQGGRNGKLQ
jgi:hypothetical protein